MSATTHAYKWKVSKPLFTKGPEGAFDDVAVKDPSIVFYEGEYHVFYTSKGTRPQAGHPCTRDSVGYVHAETLEALDAAQRVEIVTEGREIVAPHIFYFSPHKLWYLISQISLPGKCAFHAVFMTNPDITNPDGWTAPEAFTYQRATNRFWIDFWVICDDTHAHFFYTDHDGRMFRQETPVDQFPYGFGVEELAVEVRGEDDRGPWRLHEASHIYKIKGEERYLALLEAVRPHPLDANYWDSRCRFMFAMDAPSLRGPWKRVEDSDNEFWGDPLRLVNEADGTPSAYDQVSHPEAIRTGYDEKLEVESDTPDLFFQAFDATPFGDDFLYDFLPWELAIASHPSD